MVKIGLGTALGLLVYLVGHVIKLILIGDSTFSLLLGIMKKVFRPDAKDSDV